MRREVDATKVRLLIEQIGRRARGAGDVYFTGGATAVLEGWRSTTVDIDLKLDPEPAGIFEAIADLKEELEINVELAAPDQFIPPVPGWRERSRPISSHGPVRFFHYDFLAQALAKIERGHERDLLDVRAMLQRELVAASDLERGFAQIGPDLVRYPALDRDAFRDKLLRILNERDPGSGR